MPGFPGTVLLLLALLAILGFFYYQHDRVLQIPDDDGLGMAMLPPSMHFDNVNGDDGYLEVGPPREGLYMDVDPVSDAWSGFDGREKGPPSSAIMRGESRGYVRPPPSLSLVSLSLSLRLSL